MSTLKQNIILFDDDNWQNLLPLCYTRPVGALRVGIMTIAEKWAYDLNGNYSFITQEYLSDKYPVDIDDVNIILSGNLLPNKKLVSYINRLEINEAILYQDQLIAAKIDQDQFNKIISTDEVDEMPGIDLSQDPDAVQFIHRPYDIFLQNGREIKRDFDRLTAKKKSASVPAFVQTVGDNLFIEEGVELNPCILNSTTGPIYIGKNAKILDGAIIRGPFALCNDGVVKMGAKIYGPTTVGPHSKVGGEINNCVIQGYSNKGHDGFLGNSVIGEWCNLGADTNNSNLKNNYDEVKLWSYASGRFEKSGQQFVGLIMGDHSKCGINTMFNTGTVVGVHCNIYGAGYPRNFIPSFSWGGPAGYTEYKIDKAFATAERVMTRRNKTLSELDQDIYKHIFEETASYR